MNQNRILRLDEITASKIAAGEVVEKPAMVVKELVENAMDAGATEIIVDIRKGGKKLIRVVDNGNGIHRDDIDLLFERHATSKIRKIDDLYRTLTLGFRGEALASICAVAQVEVITMQAEDAYGIKAEATGGAIVSKNEIGARKGTSIAVRDLFFNTPARLKFLKSDSVELKYISEIMGHLALSHPNIAFKFSSDDNLIFKTPGDGKVENAIFSIYDKTMIRHLFEIESEFDFVKLRGYASKFDYTKGTKQHQIVFVNGRYVKSDIIKEAINLAYKPYLMNNRFPVCFLFLTINPDKIDVNIHPAKTEIKFHDDGELKQFVYTALKKAFNLQNQVPEISLTHHAVAENTAQSSTDRQGTERFVQPFESQNAIKDEISTVPVDVSAHEAQIADQVQKPGSMNPQEVNDSKLPEHSKVQLNSESNQLESNQPESQRYSEVRQQSDHTNSSKPQTSSNHSISKEGAESYHVNFKAVDLEPLITFSEELKFYDKPLESESIYDNLQYIGSFINTYLLFQKQNQLYLIDQHAAHEKILYETFVDAFQKKEMISQVLLIPEVIESDILTLRQLDVYQSYLERLGYRVENFGEKSLVMREIPSLFNLVTARTLLLEVLEGLDQRPDDMLLEKLMSKACKAAIKANDHLADIETEALINQLKGLREPYTCPHGRPIIISFSKSELERKFKRII